MGDDNPLPFGLPAEALKLVERQVSGLRAVNDRYLRSIGITFGAKSRMTHFRPTEPSEAIGANVAKGHEEQLPPPGLSVGSGLRKMVYRGGCGSAWMVSAHPLL